MGNIALNKPATANKSILPYIAAKAVDGTTAASNRWLTDQLPATLMVDLQARYLVSRWVVKHPASVATAYGWAAPNYVNSDYRLQGSNDSVTWSDIDIVTNNSASSTDRTIVPVAFRYFRVYVTKGLRCNTQTTSILEVELYQAYSAQLTALTISAGTLTPAFNTSVLSYTATVNSSVASINVTPTALSPAAVIKVNNTPVVSGGSVPVALNFGANTITVNVTDGAVAQNYTIVVTRPGSFLSSLTVQSGTTNIPLSPSFVKTTFGYTASANSSMQTVTFTPTAETAGSTITINNVAVNSGQQSAPFNLTGASSTFSIVVTDNGVATTYTVVISKAISLLLTSASVAYSGRSISGTVNVPMNSTDLTYNTTVPAASTTVKITPNAADSSATIKVNGVVVASGTQSASITLVAGTTAISIVVSNSDGSQHRDYTLNVVH